MVMHMNIMVERKRYLDHNWIEKFTNAFKKRTGVVYQNWVQGWAITERQKKKRTTLVGIEVAEDTEHKLIVDEVIFNRLGGLPKGHPFIDREWKGAIKVVKDTYDKEKEENYMQYNERCSDRTRNDC
tara:strand:+ start:19 stop:399 length:381 start_codon:yes stop_codon:yes gene_type:complete